MVRCWYQEAGKIEKCRRTIECSASDSRAGSEWPAPMTPLRGFPAQGYPVGLPGWSSRAVGSRMRMRHKGEGPQGNTYSLSLASFCTELHHFPTCPTSLHAHTPTLVSSTHTASAPTTLSSAHLYVQHPHCVSTHNVVQHPLPPLEQTYSSPQYNYTPTTATTSQAPICTILPSNLHW